MYKIEILGEIKLDTLRTLFYNGRYMKLVNRFTVKSMKKLHTQV